MSSLAKKNSRTKSERPARGRVMQANGSDQLKKRIVEAMKKCLGIVSKACDKVGISRVTFYSYYNNDPEFKIEIDAIEDLVIDFAESKLHTLIRAGDNTSTIFFLKTKGRKRGYQEKIQMDLTSGDKELTQLTNSEINDRLNNLEHKTS